MKNDSIDLLSHKELLTQIIADHIKADLKIVDSIVQYCTENGDDLSSHAGLLLGRSYISKPERSDDGMILLQRHINSSDVSSHQVALAIRIKDDRSFDLLTTPLRFAIHLVLHEIAHIKNNWPQDREIDCDRWAFEHIEKYI